MCNRRYRWNIKIHTHIYIFSEALRKAVGVREVLMQEESFEMGSERYLGYTKTRRKGEQKDTRAWTVL